jgi:hypothetical protein
LNLMGTYKERASKLRENGMDHSYMGYIYSHIERST